jgi:MFS superfamily sulfate permease-like transporter
MLAGGLIIILKQLPHAFGYDADLETNLLCKQTAITLSSLFEVFNHVQLGAIVITLVSLIILISWIKYLF